MFQRGPQPGYSPRQAALNRLPAGTTCVRLYGAGGLRGFSVQLAHGQQIGSGGNAASAWSRAIEWADRNLAPNAQVTGAVRRPVDLAVSRPVEDATDL